MQAVKNRSMDKQVSCYSSALVYNHAKNLGLTEKQLLLEIESFKETLINPYEWTSSDIWVKLARNIENGFPGRPNPLFDIGSEIIKQQMSSFQLLFLKTAPPSLILKKTKQHFENSIHKGIKVDLFLKQQGEGYISFKPENRETYSTQICDFNRGCTYGVLTLKGYRNVRIQEIQCAARGSSEACTYKFTWDPAPSIIDSIKNFLFFRFRDHHTIIKHMEESHYALQQQYQSILSIRDFYSHIMQNMQEAIIWLTENGHIEFANASFCNLTGHIPSEVEGRKFINFLADDQSKAIFEQTASLHQRYPMRQKIIELAFSRLGGETRIGQATVLWVTSDHREPGFIISIRDITESKNMERKLKLAENRYRAMYENSPALIVGLDLSGNVLYANPAMIEQTGYSEEELRSMHFSTLIAPNANFDTNRLLEGLIKQPTRLQEVRFKTKSGDWKTIAFNSYHIFDDYGVGGIAGIGIDITETKRLNEHLIKTQRMDLLGQMAGGLAHDFNNIMTAINGYAYMISQWSSEEKIRKDASTIVNAADRASVLVRKLLSFSRGDSVELKEFDLCELMKEAGALIRGTTPSNVKVLYDIPETPVYIIGDPTKIHQCILNLGVNSRDAIGRKSNCSITLSLKTSPKDKNRIWIQIDDTGTGIPPDIIDRIFDPFFSTKEKKEGTGLGLSVVYGIIKSHEGDILIDSRPGEGTTFTLDLPLKPSMPFSEKSESHNSESSVFA